MKVNDIKINGIVVKDKENDVIAVINDKGAYFFKGYTVEILDDDLDVYVDPSGEQLMIIKKDDSVRGSAEMFLGEPELKIEKIEDEEYEGVIIDGVDFTS